MVSYKTDQKWIQKYQSRWKVLLTFSTSAKIKWMSARKCFFRGVSDGVHSIFNIISQRFTISDRGVSSILNLCGQVVMRRLLICQILVGLLPTLPTRHLHPNQHRSHFTQKFRPTSFAMNLILFSYLLNSNYIRLTFYPSEFGDS